MRTMVFIILLFNGTVEFRPYEYELKDAVQAHKAIESGTTLGASVLIP